MTDQLYAVKEMPLTDAIITIEGIREDEKRFTFWLQEKSALVNKAVSVVRGRIEAGETTGDHIRDMVIRTYGFDPEAEEKYREFEKRLAGKQGEFVLVAYSGERNKRHIFGKGWERESAEFFRLGVLEGEELVCRNAPVYITLPTSRYIQDQNTFFPKGAELGRLLTIKQGDLFVDPFFDESPPPLETFVRNPQAGLVLGDKAVENWLENHLMLGFYKPAADALSKLILEPTEG